MSAKVQVALDRKAKLALHALQLLKLTKPRARCIVLRAVPIDFPPAALMPSQLDGLLGRNCSGEVASSDASVKLLLCRSSPCGMRSAPCSASAAPDTNGPGSPASKRWRKQEIDRSPPPPRPSALGEALVSAHDRHRCGSGVSRSSRRARTIWSRCHPRSDLSPRHNLHCSKAPRIRARWHSARPATGLSEPEGKVIGVDMAEEILVKARSTATALANSIIEFREGLAERLPV